MPRHPSLSLSLSLSPSFFLTLSLSPSLFLSLYLPLSLSLSLSLTGEEGVRELQKVRSCSKHSSFRLRQLKGAKALVNLSLSLFISLSVFISLSLSLSLTGEVRACSKHSLFSQSVGMRDYYINKQGCLVLLQLK